MNITSIVTIKHSEGSTRQQPTFTETTRTTYRKHVQDHSDIKGTNLFFPNSCKLTANTLRTGQVQQALSTRPACCWLCHTIRHSGWVQWHNKEATPVCRLVRLQIVVVTVHLWLVILIGCSVIVLIGLLFRDLFCVSFLINTVQACTVNSDQIKQKHRNYTFSACVNFYFYFFIYLNIKFKFF